MPTSAKTGSCYTGLIGATVLAAIRTISGFALARLFIKFSNIINVPCFYMVLRICWNAHFLKQHYINPNRRKAINAFRDFLEID
jgi:hypothetical protein